MPRYEMDTKFWEIELAGSKYTQKWGKTGGSVSMNSKDCATPDAARKAYDKAIAKKESEGFALVGGKAKKGKEPKAAPAQTASKPNPALEKAILANPDDTDAYLVLADWLQGQGDPRGELIALQHAGKKKEATALLKKHPELTPVITPKPETYELEWSCGFIKRAHLGWPMFADGSDDDGDGEELDTDAWRVACQKALLGFLQHPSARFLQALRLGCIPGEEEMSTSPFAAAIEKASPPCLVSLRIDDTGDWDISSTNATIPGSSSLARLEELVIRAGSIRMGKLELPKLRSLRLESGSLNAKNLKEVAKASWKKLEKLELWCGDPRYGANGTVKDLAPLFAATGVPALKHLGLMNCPFADEGVKALASSKLLKQLTTLDLRMGNLSDRGVDTLIAHKDAFKHLDLLDVDDNALTEASKPRLKGLAKKVNWGSSARSRQTPDRAVPRTEDNSWSRYVSVGE